MLDLLLENGTFLTQDRSRPLAQRLGIWGGRIVGLDEQIDGLPARERIDLRGATVLPGFVDAHVHLAWAGHEERATDLRDVGDRAGALARLATAAAAAPAGGWVDVVGYDQRPLGGHLTRAELDAVADGRRFDLVHTSGHARLVGTAALRQIPRPAGGWPPGVVVDDDGEPTGLFLEDATALVAALRSPRPLAELVDDVAAAARRCAAQGVTAVAEAGVGAGLTSRSPVEARALAHAPGPGRLPVRARLMVAWGALSELAGERTLAPGLATGFGSDRLALGAVKAWLDGGMMARTAALTAPYRVPGGGSGELAADLPALRAAVVAAHASGWQLALHAIGDRAVDEALDIVATAQNAHPRPARHRIEHAGLVRPDQLPRMAALGVTAVVQPTFLHAWGDDYAAVMGPDRADWLYRGRAFLDAGVPLAGSSDRPVSDGAPLRAVRFLVTRRTRTGAVVGPAEALTVEQALRAHTLGAARACGLDGVCGSLERGKAADLVVLAADPRAVGVEEIADIAVTTTVLDGAVTHGRWPG